MPYGTPLMGKNVEKQHKRGQLGQQKQRTNVYNEAKKDKIKTSKRNQASDEEQRYTRVPYGTPLMGKKVKK